MEDKELKVTRKGQDTYTESGTEYVLPDYNTDVRKILYSEASIRPGSKFMGEDEAEFSGQIAYKVIYSDSENKITGTEFFSDYEIAVKPQGGGMENANCDTRVSQFAIRLLGPRKFSAKSSVGAQTRFTEKANLTPNMWDKAEEGEIQTKIKNLKVRNSLSCGAEEREIAESLGHLDGVTEDEVKILYYKAEPIIDESSICENGILLRGRIAVFCVIEIEGNAAYMLKKAVPFEETVPEDGVKKDMYIFPTLTVTSEKFLINPDETGCEVVANIIVEYSARLEENETVSIVSDAFITSCPTENSYSDFSYTELLERVLHTSKCESSTPRSELCEGTLREVVFVNSFPKIESVRLENKRAEIKGEIKYVGVTSEVNDDGSISYSGLKFTAPFEENVNINCQTGDKTNAEVRITVKETNAGMDTERVYFSTEFNLDVLVLDEKSERVVLECFGREKERYSGEKATVKVYYPDSDEDAFSVARKFHVSISSLCENNSISVSAIADGGSCGRLPRKIIVF